MFPFFLKKDKNNLFWEKKWENVRKIFSPWFFPVQVLDKILKQSLGSFTRMLRKQKLINSTFHRAHKPASLRERSEQEIYYNEPENYIQLAYSTGDNSPQVRLQYGGRKQRGCHLQLQSIV